MKPWLQRQQSRRRMLRLLEANGDEAREMARKKAKEAADKKAKEAAEKAKKEAQKKAKEKAAKKKTAPGNGKPDTPEKKPAPPEPAVIPFGGGGEEKPSIIDKAKARLAQMPPEEAEPGDEGEGEPEQEQPKPPAPPKKAPPPPKPEPKVHVSIDRRFTTLVNRVRRRYKALGSKGKTVEHIGDLGVLTEAQGRSRPLFLAEEANWKAGAFVSLWPTDTVQRKLAIMGGVPPEDIHLTLVYLGRIDKLGHATIATAASVCERVAKNAKPFTGLVTGTGRFNATTPHDPDVIYASFTSPRLDDLRIDLLQQLTRADVPYTRKYGFTPHMTLAKIPQAAITPMNRVRPFRLRFSWISLTVGEWRHDYKLGA